MMQNASIEALLKQGHEQLERGQYEAAIETFQQAAELEPQNPQVLCGLGLAFYQPEQYQESFEQAIQIEPQDYEGWFNRGFALDQLQQYEDALASYDRAIEIKPNSYNAWNRRGVVLCDNFQQYEEAITSFNEALKIKPDFYEAWYNRGNVLYNLGRYEEAIASWDKAIDIIPAYYLVWQNRGDALCNIGCYEEAIASWNKALQIQPDFYQAWGCRGDALSELGCYEEAVCSYDKALAIQPNYYEAWYGRGNALVELGFYEKARDSYKKALTIHFNFEKAWTNLGRVQNKLGRYENTILSCDRALHLTHNQLWQAWDNRGWALYYSQEGYYAALKNWDEGLQQICPETPDNREGCGVLHYDKGYAHYDYGQQQLNPYPYLQKARSSYQKALKFLTMEEFPELYLEVLHDLIKVCLGLSKANEAKKLLNRGTVLLEQLIADTPSEGYKLQLSRKFYRFYQLRVDIWVRSGNFQKALELAEERKNLCLRWLRENRYIQTDRESPKYITIQQLLNPHTAAIYWHVSPAAITTFILRHNQPLQVHSALATVDDVTYPTAACQLCDFENWVNDWKQNYQDYRAGKEKGTEEKLSTVEGKKPAPKDHPWRKEMTAALEELKTILDIPGIVPHISGIHHLILIPHRDLHLLPLHDLFPEDFTITYLPSAQIGLDLQKSKANPGQRLLNVVNPQQDLRYAPVESAAISLLYPESTLSIKGLKATKIQVMTAMQTDEQLGVFHFTGHGQHDINQPLESSLLLAGEDKLTLRDIFQLDLSRYHLICLSACETALTSKQGLIDEFVGLVSGFLAKGTTYVISTLWAVNDYSTALLMVRFYQCLQVNMTPPDALKEAQKWLRTVTHPQLIEWYQDLAAKFEGKNTRIQRDLNREVKRLKKDSATINPDQPLYTHPYYWAGFTVTGKV